MKKQKLPVAILLATILVGACVFIPVMLLQSREEQTNEDTLYWLPDESYFVDYEIVEGKVKFRYAICFVNNSGNDCFIKLSAKFATKDLKGWAENNEFFDGCDENGEWEYRKVKNGEKSVLVYTFTTKYLGGPVNTNLSFPEDLMLVEKLQENS